MATTAPIKKFTVYLGDMDHIIHLFADGSADIFNPEIGAAYTVECYEAWLHYA